MLPQWSIIALIVLTLLSSTIGQVRGEAVSATVGEDSVAVNMNLVLQENLTSLPVVDIRLDLTNSTAVVQPLVQPITSEIQRLVPGAKLSSLAFGAKSTNLTGTWRLKENYSMIVTGVTKNSGSSIRADLSFITMNVMQSIQVGTTELNGVGQAFLLPALEAKAASYSNLQYYIDGSKPNTPLIPEQTTKQFWLLDFSWITPISKWTLNNDILGQVTNWTLDPPTSRYNLTLVVPSPEGLPLAIYAAIYNPSFSLRVPSIAWVSGNTMYFDLPNPSEAVMPAIVVASLMIGILVSFVDRRLTGRPRGRKNRR